MNARPATDDLSAIDDMSLMQLCAEDAPMRLRFAAEIQRRASLHLKAAQTVGGSADGAVLAQQRAWHQKRARAFERLLQPN